MYRAYRVLHTSTIDQCRFQSSEYDKETVIIESTALNDPEAVHNPTADANADVVPPPQEDASAHHEGIAHIVVMIV